ncbi:MAG: thioredoxin [Agathobacter sp.]|nr:thioredoxin [Agathobacter sp.]
MYSIDPMMSYGQAVSCYESYAQDMRKQGKKPVTFLRFITGRY